MALASFASVELFQCRCEYTVAQGVNGSGRPCAYLEQQAGVLAGLSLQQRPLLGSGPEHQAKVPGRRDGYLILQVPPERTVTQEAMGVEHDCNDSHKSSSENTDQMCRTCHSLIR